MNTQSLYLLSAVEIRFSLLGFQASQHISDSQEFTSKPKQQISNTKAETLMKSHNSCKEATKNLLEKYETWLLCVSGSQYENLCSKIQSFVNVFFCSGHWKLEVSTFPAISYELTGSLADRTRPILGKMIEFGLQKPSWLKRILIKLPDPLLIFEYF